MRTQTSIGRRLLVLIACAALGSVFGCGATEDTDDNSLIPPPGGCSSVAGDWAISETENATACGDGIGNFNYTLTVQVSGCNLTVTSNAVSGVFTGSMSGSSVIWSGSYAEEGGTTTVNANATISTGTLQGSTTWSWTDGVDSCSGTSTFSGARY